MEQIKCKYCGKVFYKKGLCVSHEKHDCNYNPDRLPYKRKNNLKNINEQNHLEWKCSCGQIFQSRRKLQAHHKECEIFLHHKGHNQFTYAKEHGLPIPEGTQKGKPGTWLGRQHTEEEKKKISESMKKFYEGKSIWYTQIEKRKSYAEQYFESIFTKAERNYHVDRYFLDFAWIDKKYYVEVDGEQHYTDKGIEHDRIRTERLKELGWVCIKRIRWSEFKKLSDIEKEKIISDILSVIN